MASGFDGDSVLQQEQDLIAQFGFGLGVRHCNPRAPRLEKKRGSDSGFSQADDKHAFVVEVH